MRASWDLGLRLFVWGLGVAFLSFASAGFAQQVRASYDEFGNRTLSVDGWRLILPRMYQDSNTGELWLDWQYPDGTGRGFGTTLDAHLRTRGFDAGTPHDPQDLAGWFREGDVPPGESRQNSWSLPGYDLEYTRALIAWWEQGNDGCYDLVTGDWVEVDCGDLPPDDADAGAADLPVCPAGMNPFEAAAANCRIVITGTSESGSIPQDVQEAFEAYREANERCTLNPTSDNCAARDRAYRAWVDLMEQGR